MHGNSFATRDGAHVTGAVAMALDGAGNAVPIEADTPIGTVGFDPAALAMFCRALAAHAAILTGRPKDELAAEISAFALAPVRP